MGCDAIQINRGKTNYWWTFPRMKTVQPYNNKPVSSPIDFTGGFTFEGKCYDREQDPDDDTHVPVLLFTPVITQYVPASTDTAFIEARNATLGGDVFATGYTIEDFDGFLWTVAAADTKHSVTAINTAIEYNRANGFQAIWGGEATLALVVKDIGSGYLDFLPDKVRT